MNNRRICICFFLLLAGSCAVDHASAIGRGFGNPAQQYAGAGSAVHVSDPLASLSSTFPHSIALKQNGHLLEFCPDNTCHGFVSSGSVPVAVLKDFAYLYIYFFSEYAYLPDWRNHPEAKDTAQRILAKPGYRKCKAESDLQSARCVLLDLARNGKIKLIFIRYDEHQRNVVPEDITKELSNIPDSPR
jgi:hypothetical protein